MQKVKTEKVAKDYLLLSQNESEFTKNKQLKHKGAPSRTLSSWDV